MKILKDAWKKLKAVVRQPLPAEQQAQDIVKLIQRECWLATNHYVNLPNLTWTPFMKRQVERACQKRIKILFETLNSSLSVPTVVCEYDATTKQIVAVINPPKKRGKRQV